MELILLAVGLFLIVGLLSLIWEVLKKILPYLLAIGVIVGGGWLLFLAAPYIWAGLCWLFSGIWAGLCWLFSGIWAGLCWLFSALWAALCWLFKIVLVCLKWGGLALLCGLVIGGIVWLVLPRKGE